MSISLSLSVSVFVWWKLVDLLWRHRTSGFLQLEFSDLLREKVVLTVRLLQMEALLGSGTKGILRDIEKGLSCFKDVPVAPPVRLSLFVCF